MSLTDVTISLRAKTGETIIDEFQVEPSSNYYFTKLPSLAAGNYELTLLTDTSLLPRFFYRENGERLCVLRQKRLGSGNNLSPIRKLRTNFTILDEFETTPRSGNDITLVQLLPFGIIEIWKIAVVSHKRLRLVVQKRFEISCFRSENQIMCPFLNHKPQILQLINTQFSPSLLPLEPHFLGNKVNAERPEWLTTQVGCIKFWDHVRGYGEVHVAEGVGFIFWDHVFLSRKKPEDYFSLVSGTRVVYKLIQPIEMKEKKYKLSWLRV